MYEEGEDLDEEEVAANAANLPKTLQSLPGLTRLHPPVAHIVLLNACAKSLYAKHQVHKPYCMRAHASAM